MDEKLVKVLPQMNGEFLYIPFVGAIIERVVGGEKQVLVQTREKKSDPKYSGSLEIPGGKFRANEDVYYKYIRTRQKKELYKQERFIGYYRTLLCNSNGQWTIYWHNISLQSRR